MRAEACTILTTQQFQGNTEKHRLADIIGDIKNHETGGKDLNFRRIKAPRPGGIRYVVHPV